MNVNGSRSVDAECNSQAPIANQQAHFGLRDYLQFSPFPSPPKLVNFGHITPGTTSHIELFTMVTEQQTVAETGVDLPVFASHEVRITQGGKIRAWVEFALKFFEVCKC